MEPFLPDSLCGNLLTARRFTRLCRSLPRQTFHAQPEHVLVSGQLFFSISRTSVGSFSKFLLRRPFEQFALGSELRILE